MRQAYAHDAVVLLDGGDPRALGAAVTVALCGRWEHPPPCPLAPHHTSSVRSGDDVRVRVLFVAEPAQERRVRSLIETALRSGELLAPDGSTTRWRFGSAVPGTLSDDDRAHAARMAASGR